MGRRAGPPEPGSRPGVTAATRLAWADLVTGVFQSCPLEAPVGGGEPADPVAVAATDGPAAVSSGSAAGAAGAGSVPAGAVSDGAGCSGGAGTGSAGGAGGLSGSLGFPVRVGPAASGSSGDRTSRQEALRQEMLWTRVWVPRSAAAGPPGKRPTVMARTAADAVVEATRKTGEDGVIATFRCAQSPTAAFLVCPVVFYNAQQGRKSTGSAALPTLPCQPLFSGGSATWILRAFPRPTTYPRPGMKSGLIRPRDVFSRLSPFDVSGVQQQAPPAGFEGLGQGPGGGPGGGFGFTDDPLVRLDGRRHQLAHTGLRQGVGELRKPSMKMASAPDFRECSTRSSTTSATSSGPTTERFQMGREATADRRAPM
jgi:hypothetical protein